MHIATVTESDLPDLLPLVRAYCDFYEVTPGDDELLALSRALIADPDLEGFQLIARDNSGRAVGFATVFWTWSTLTAAREAIMNDLFVHSDARGSGLADALIEECRVRVQAPRRRLLELADREGQRQGSGGLRASRGKACRMDRLLAGRLSQGL